MLKEPVSLSSIQQVEKLLGVLGHPDNRPIRPLNARTVIELPRPLPHSGARWPIGAAPASLREAGVQAFKAGDSHASACPGYDGPACSVASAGLLAAPSERYLSGGSASAPSASMASTCSVQEP